MNIVIDIRALMAGKLTGVEVYVSNLIKALEKIDKKNAYFLFANAHDKNVLKNLEKYDLPKSFQLIFTKIPNKILNISLSLLSFPKIDKLILQKVKNLKKIDLFFMPDLRPISLSPNVSLITTFHDIAFLKYPQHYSKRSRFFFKLIRPGRLVKRSNKIIAVSEFTKSELLSQFKIDEDKIHVIYEGPGTKMDVDLSKEKLIEFKKKYKLTNDFFLYLASINPRKNFEKLIKAFRVFKSQTDKKIDLVIAGDINTKLFPVNLVEKKYKDIKYIGFIEEKDKAYLYLLAKAFVNISLYEGFALTVLEAFQCGTPVVCSDSTALNEIASGAALLVDPNNTFAMTSDFNKVLDEEMSKKLRKNGFSKVAMFSWDKAAKETLKLFTSVF